MKIKNILEKVYRSDKGFLISYFSELDKINTYYCQALLKKKYLDNKELLKNKENFKYFKKK